MEPVPPPSLPRFGARGQRLKTSAELRASRSVGSKKRLARRWTNWGAPVPPSLEPYAYGGASSSGAGSSSSRRRRRHTPSPPPSLSSGFSSEESEEEEDGDRVVEGDFIASDEAEARVLARMKRRSERARFRESEPLNPPPTSPSTLAPATSVPAAAAASTHRALLRGLSPSKPLPPLTVRLLHGRLLRLDLLADLSHLLLRALFSSGLHLHALSLHSLFPDPSHLTLPFALNSASRLPYPLPVGEQLHARSLKLPSHSNPHVLTSLTLYAKCGLLDRARGVFDEMRCPSTASCTTLIAACMDAGRVKEAVAAARKALASGMRPDSITAVRVLTACAQAAGLDAGEAAWRAALRDRVATRLFVATATVNLYVKCGQIAKAREVFDRMPEKDAVAWGAMVGGYASSGHPREALELFFAMRNQGVRPDCYTVADALSACTRLGKLDLGRRAAGAVDWDEFLDDPVLGAALIGLYVKSGSTWDAWSVFQQMRNRDIVVWNKMILGLGTTGHGKTAFALVGQMEKSGMKLNDSTFVGILCSCAHTGVVKDGWRYFHNMVELYRFIPRVDHYGCMVDLLSRAGLLQEAHRLINDMPMKANAVVWGALLGGCKIH
ncbi:hypothetical protein ACQ4PT_045498 [Festuca glaucescens]